MRAVVGSDIHGSSKTRRKLETFRRILRDFTELSIAYGTYKVIHAGDIFDHRWGGPPPEVVLVLLEELEYAASRGVLWVLLGGNHDIHSKSDMDLTLLRAFNKLATIITEPKVVTLEGGGALFFSPWRPIPELKRDLMGLAKQAIRISGPRVLFCHTPLKEGSISASNFQRRDLTICVQDLFADRYDLVLLGDYHKAQKVGVNAYYLGSPVEHTFGDDNPGGAYLLDMSRATPALHRLELPTKHPRYRTYDLLNAVPGEPLHIPGYDPDDYNRIRVPMDREAAAAKAFPHAVVTGVATSDGIKRLGRLGNADPSKPVENLLEFCKVKQWGEGHYRVGTELLQKAMGIE